MIGRNRKQYPNPTYQQTLDAWCLLNDLIKLGYPHDFQKELPHIRSYMWKVTDLVRDAIHIRDGRENEVALEVLDFSGGRMNGKDAEPHWIPCSEIPPENMEPVNITWVNRDPVSYYTHIKDKPFTATGIYFKGKWYWYSATCEDILEEYGENDIDVVDDSIEITAWRPLPEPYEGEGK